MYAFDDALVGKTAVVTGGSKGIGRAIANAMVRSGAGVAIWSRSQVQLRATAAEINAFGIACDITDREAVGAAMDTTIRQLGGLDIFVANAGIPGSNHLFPETTDEEWDSVIFTNLTGTFNTVRAAARRMVEAGRGGKIIVVSSIAGRLGMARAVEYSAAKAGLAGLVRSAAVALARHDIQVNAVLPGWVETDLSANQLGDEKIGEKLLRATPARRFGSADDIAGICLYLASDLSGFHTGDSIVVDGGYSAS